MTESLSLPRTVDVRTCYLCGSDGERLHDALRDSLFGVPGLWSLLRCPQCGLVWLHPCPRRDEVLNLYVRYHTHSPSIGEDWRASSIRRSSREAVLHRVCGYEADPLPAGGGMRRLMADAIEWLDPFQDVTAGSVMWLPASRRGRLLDVGCGSGEFMAKMRGLGWETVGIEPDPVAAKTARSHQQLDVVCASLEEAGLPAESFDVVTMSHVIEHVHDPIGFLGECRRLLRPDGVMVVVTPNSRSLGSRWFGRSWRGWEVPRHLFVFSPRTLGACAERAGLQIDELRTTARSARGIWHESRSLHRSVRRQGKDRRRRMPALSFWFLEHLLARAVDCGEEILMIARRTR